MVFPWFYFHSIFKIVVNTRWVHVEKMVVCGKAMMLMLNCHC